MTATEIIEEIRPLGKDSYKKVLLNHGIKEPFFGVKVEYLKKIQKRVKKDYQLASIFSKRESMTRCTWPD